MLAPKCVRSDSLGPWIVLGSESDSVDSTLDRLKSLCASSVVGTRKRKFSPNQSVLQLRLMSGGPA